jgi:hypothetical protein
MEGNREREECINYNSSLVAAAALGEWPVDLIDV